MTRNSDALKRNGTVMAVMKVASYPRSDPLIFQIFGQSQIRVIGNRLGHMPGLPRPVSFSFDQLSIVYFDVER